METIIRKIDKNQINQDVIEEAGNVLKQGGLVAFPTETVYGLGADALKGGKENICSKRTSIR